MRFLRYLWALPYTLLGVCLGIFGWSWPRVESGALIFEDVGGIPRQIIEWKGAGAFCLGHTIVGIIPIEGRVLRHELIHVRQYERWGIFFIPAYLWSSWRTDGLMNRFEAEAYKHQDETDYHKKGRYDMPMPEELSHEDQAILREMSYIVRKAELTDMIGTEKPWEEREDEPLTLADFRRLPPGSDERELILCHLLIDIWNEVDHLRHHVCPHAEEDDEIVEDD